MKGSIEQLVILSKQGVLTQCGAVVLEDFSLASVRGSLTDEDIKTLFDVRDGGCIESKRWGAIEFPPGLPRLFGFNESAQALLGIISSGCASSHQQAQLKRVCVAGLEAIVTTPLITSAAKANLNEAADDDHEEDMRREEAWWLSRGGRPDRVAGIADPFLPAAPTE